MTFGSVLAGIPTRSKQNIGSGVHCNRIIGGYYDVLVRQTTLISVAPTMNNACEKVVGEIQSLAS